MAMQFVYVMSASLNGVDYTVGFNPQKRCWYSQTMEGEVKVRAEIPARLLVRIVNDKVELLTNLTSLAGQIRTDSINKLNNLNLQTLDNLDDVGASVVLLREIGRIILTLRSLQSTGAPVI